MAQLSTAHLATSLEMARFCSSFSASRAQTSLTEGPPWRRIWSTTPTRRQLTSTKISRRNSPQKSLSRPSQRNGEASSGSPCLATISTRTSRGVGLIRQKRIDLTATADRIRKAPTSERQSPDAICHAARPLGNAFQPRGAKQVSPGQRRRARRTLAFRWSGGWCPSLTEGDAAHRSRAQRARATTEARLHARLFRVIPSTMITKGSTLGSYVSALRDCRYCRILRRPDPRHGQRLQRAAGLGGTEAKRQHRPAQPQRVGNLRLLRIDDPERQLREPRFQRQSAQLRGVEPQFVARRPR